MRPCSRSSRRCKTSRCLDRLELEGAARRVDNSIAGDATTYTYALRWSPIEDVQFRGNKTKSIRAPSITELFMPSASIDFSSPMILAIRTSWVRAQCRRREKRTARPPLPATTRRTSPQMSSMRRVLGTTSGNTGLQSEVAFSKTFGAVLRPRFVPKLNISVDYIDICSKRCDRVIDAGGQSRRLLRLDQFSRTIRPAARSHEMPPARSRTSTPASSTPDFWNSRAFRRPWITPSSCRGLWGAWRPVRTTSIPRG